MQIQFVNKGVCDTPKYETEGSAGMDVRANISESIELQKLERKLIPTGLFLEMPLGIECQIRPRSGLAYKKGITVLNSPGTIDSDYRGEIGVLLINLSSESVIIEPNERIAQLVFCPTLKVELNKIDELNITKRGSGGFGSTGLK